jgi:transcriptional regulator with XRE-family HTH domain
MTDLSTRFGANLKALRKSVGLSQDELADRAAIHRTQIWKFENGATSPSLEALVKLAGALGADLNRLLAGVRWVPLDAATAAIVRGSFVLDPEDADGVNA